MKLLLIFLLSFSALAKNVAVVKLFRGAAKVIGSDRKEQSIAMGMWINEGDIVKTSPNSFVRLSFIDKSTVNVGPQSELKVEKFSKNEAGVLDVIQGKIRAKVSKDYLDMDESQSKLFVKSKAAVMGIRGTDFIYSVGSKNEGATAILFEGSVVFNKINKGDNLKNLESIVNRGRRINPGSFSVVSSKLTAPTIPAKLNSKQLRAMEKDVNFSNEGVSSQKHSKSSKVPAGISGDIVSSSESSIKDTIAKDLSLDVNIETQTNLDLESSKYQKSDDGIKPADGTIVILDSNAILPVGADATFDSNTKEWVSSEFQVGSGGEVIAPENVEIQNDGTIQKTVDSKVYAIEMDSIYTNETQVLGYEAPAKSATGLVTDTSTQVDTQQNSANANDWYVPPSQISVPTHQAGGVTNSGFTQIRATFSTTP